MATFTQAEIDSLIQCPKEISEAPTRDMRKDGAYLRNDAKLVATDDTKGFFTLFIRESAFFAENFSVGLNYHALDGRSELKLLRCNGKHGKFNRGNNAFDPSHPHWAFHVHRATQDALDLGFEAGKTASVATEFASVKEAVQYLLKTVNLNAKDSAKYFPVNRQTELDFDAN